MGTAAAAHPPLTLNSDAALAQRAPPMVYGQMHWQCWAASCHGGSSLPSHSFCCSNYCDELAYESFKLDLASYQTVVAAGACECT